MKRKISNKLLILLGVLLFLGCNGQTRNNANKDELETGSDNNNNMTNNLENSETMIDSNFIQQMLNKDLILKRIAVQNSWENMDISNSEYYHITEEDIEVGGYVSYYGLLKKGFKPVSEDAFNSKIKDIFGVDLTKKSFYIIDHTTFFTRLMPSDASELNDIVTLNELNFESHNYFFYKKEKIISTVIPFIFNVLNSNGIPFNPLISDNEFHYNNYIFNNSKASLTWLINNDIWYLETLVREFGYGKEPTINKEVLAKIYEKYSNTQPQDYQSLIQLFAVKDRDKKLQIREDLIKYIIANTSQNNRGLLDMLESYGYLLRSALDHDFNLYTDAYKDFSREDKIKVIAYIAYYVQPLYDKYQIEVTDGSWTRSLLYNFIIQNPNEIDYLKSVNYYGLSDYPKIIEHVREVIFNSSPAISE